MLANQKQAATHAELSTQVVGELAHLRIPKLRVSPDGVERGKAAPPQKKGMAEVPGNDSQDLARAPLPLQQRLHGVVQPPDPRWFVPDLPRRPVEDEANRLQSLDALRLIPVLETVLVQNLLEEKE